MWLAEGKSSPAKVVPLGRNPRRNETILEMTVFEGRNREIRRVFAKVGLIVRRLLRISIGPLELKGLQPGEARSMTRQELKFVDDAQRMYAANKEAWDAEFPGAREEGRVWRPAAARRSPQAGRAAAAAAAAAGSGVPGVGGGGRFGCRGSAIVPATATAAGSAASATVRATATVPAWATAPATDVRRRAAPSTTPRAATRPAVPAARRPAVPGAVTGALRAVTSP